MKPQQPKLCEKEFSLTPVSTKSASDSFLRGSRGVSPTGSFTSSQQSITRSKRESSGINFSVHREGLLVAYDLRTAHILYDNLEIILGRNVDQLPKTLATIRDRQAPTATEQARLRHSGLNKPTVSVEHVLKLSIIFRQYLRVDQHLLADLQRWLCQLAF